MIVYTPIAIVYTCSYYVINMIHATYLLMLILVIVGVFMECENRPEIEMDTSTFSWIIFTT
jgi:hypothetical protein